MQTLSNNVRIAYDDIGHGEPALLFMAGWCDNRPQYSRLAPRCATQKRCLVIDWPGHGESESPRGDFGEKDLVEAAIAVINRSGAQQVAPVSTAHSGWVSIEPRRRLRERIPKLVLLDWLVLEPPPPFLEALRALQSREHWEETRNQLVIMWLASATDPEIATHIRNEMGAYEFEMWARAGREIGASYSRAGGPLKALSDMKPTPQVLHLYSQPKDAGFL